MFTSEDLQLLAKRGITEAQVMEQLECFKKGFPYLTLDSPASISRGVIKADDAALEVASDDCWGASDPTKRINNPVVREMVITGADPSSIDKETYTEKEMDKAFTAIRKSQNAESNFADNDSDDNSTGSWGSSSSFDEDGDEPW